MEKKQGITTCDKHTRPQQPILCSDTSPNTDYNHAPNPSRDSILNPLSLCSLKPPLAKNICVKKTIDLLWHITDIYINKYIYPNWNTAEHGFNTVDRSTAK